MAKTEAESPKLATMKYQVTSIINSKDRVTVMLVSDRAAGGGTYVVKKIKRESPADDIAIERAKAEAIASAKLGHPVILKVHDCAIRRSWFRVSHAEMLMEYVTGKTLFQLKKLTLPTSIIVFHHVAAAIAHMHRRGVAHGDLRLSKIHVTKSGQVKVRGYGLSQLPVPLKIQFQPNKIYGAPEQFKEKVVNEKVDIYSLGANLYHVLTGKQPTRSGDGPLAKPKELNGKIPTDLSDLVASALEVSPQKRPPDMYEIVTRLEAISKEMKLDDAHLKALHSEEKA